MAVDMEKIEMTNLERDDKMDKTVSVLAENYIQIRAGRANPHVLDKILVEYYGQMTPINQVGNLSVQNGNNLIITPWDKSTLKNIEKAIQVSDIGINPINDGTIIRLVFPQLTEERRKEICKQIKKDGEDAKVAIRNVRRDTLEVFKKMKTNKEITEDEYAQYEQETDKATSKKIEAVDKLMADKEKEILTV